jgi:hypothetical protein
MTSITGLGTSAGLLSQQAFGVRQRQQHEVQQDPAQGVAKALGMSTEDLKSAMQSGKSLNDLANEKGVAHNDLIAAIKTGMPTDRVNQTDNTDGTQMAQNITSRNGMPGPPPDGPGGAPAGANGTTANGRNNVSDSTKNAVSSLLDGQDSTGLNAVTNSKQLIDFLQHKGVDLNSLRNVLNSGNLVDVTA